MNNYPHAGTAEQDDGSELRQVTERLEMEARMRDKADAEARSFREENLRLRAQLNASEKARKVRTGQGVCVVSSYRFRALAAYTAAAHRTTFDAKRQCKSIKDL